MTPGRHRPGLVTIALAAIAVLAVVLAVTAVGSPSATPAVATRTVTVGRGVVQQTVSGSGNLAPANQADLNFATSGELTHLYVKTGSHVVDGQLLAQIDPSAQQVALAQAQANLQSAQDALDAAQTAATTTATAAATTTPTSPRGAAAAQGQSGAATSTLTVAAATANVQSAQLSVTSAQQALDATKLFAPIAATVTSVNGAVGEAVGPSGSGSSSSTTSSSTSSSGASIARGLGGGGTASSSGSGSSSSALIVLSQLSHLSLQVSLTEADVGKVRAGQPATVTVSATGDELAGHVTSIGLLPSSSGGASSAVSYPVTIGLDQSSPSVRSGMSATASIVTAQATGIAVPSQAITAGTVTVVRDGKNASQAVTTGLVGDSSTQVISGLDAGAQIVVRSPTASATLSTTSSATQFPGAGRGGFGGGGFGGGAGGAGGQGGGAGFGRLRALVGGGGG